MGLRPASTLTVDAHWISLGSSNSSTSPWRTERYGLRFLPFRWVSTDTSATPPQPMGGMKSMAAVPPLRRTKSTAASVTWMSMLFPTHEHGDCFPGNAVRPKRVAAKYDRSCSLSGSDRSRCVRR